MGDPMVSAFMGAMASILSKLHSMIQEKNADIKDAWEDLSSLKRDLGVVEGAMRNFTRGPQPDAQVKEWMRQVREMVYHCEDYLDDLCAPHPPAPAATEKKGGAYKGLIPWKQWGGRKSSEVSKRIQELKKRVKDAHDRLEAFNLRWEDSFSFRTVDNTAATAAPTDPIRRQPSYSLPPAPKADDREDDGVVGLDGQTNDLVAMIKDVGQETHLKVVSIIGLEGVGKTTLAKEVSRSLPVPFDCRAFVSVGCSTPIKTILLSILRQVTRSRLQHVDKTSTDELDVIQKLKGHLTNKRYLIIVDDLWSTTAWKVIKSAMPESNCGSRVITTTRSNEVADSCSSRPCIHVMASLSDVDAERLFWSRVRRSSGEENKPDAARQDLSSVLRACGGVPLAIVAMAGLLTNWIFTDLQTWEVVWQRAMAALDQYQEQQGIARILQICYSDLSLPVRTCFLYLSCFPENQTIGKDRLIWRWIAEGFIPPSSEGMWTTGENYLNELVRRRLVRRELTDDDDSDPVGCAVHGAVLDFIVSMSKEENFVTADAGLRSLPRDVIRRLSLTYGDQLEDGDNQGESGLSSLVHLRSLTVFGGAPWLMPHLADFRYLRVLDLQDAQNVQDEHICNFVQALFNLRYLALAGEGVKRLPDDIDKLQNLETLDVRKTRVKELPASIVNLKKLTRLLAADLTMLEGMEEMRTLREVRMIRVSETSSPEQVAKLVRMKEGHIRVLGINWCVGDTIQGQQFADKFGTALENIGNSKVECLLLHAVDATQTSLDGMADAWKPPCFLKRFVMTSSGYYFPKVPLNLKEHEHLAHLTISIVRLSVEDLQLMGALPKLVVLKLHTRESLSTTITSKNGFGRLHLFCFGSNDGGLGLVFSAGAMPNLHKLSLFFKASADVRSVEINHLSSLKHVQVQIQATVDRRDAHSNDSKDTEDAIKEQVCKFGSNKPSLEVILDQVMQEKTE